VHDRFSPNKNFYFVIFRNFYAIKQISTSNIDPLYWGGGGGVLLAAFFPPDVE
jgi:hypothetical protein